MPCSQSFNVNPSRLIGAGWYWRSFGSELLIASSNRATSIVNPPGLRAFSFGFNLHDIGKGEG